MTDTYKLTRPEIIALFPDISPTAIVKGCDGLEIRGKWAVVTPMEDYWDVWIMNPKDLAKGLGARKVTNMLEAIKVCVKADFHELTGEAWFRVWDHKEVSKIRHLLGIRKKRRVTAAQLENLRKYSK